MFWKKNHLKFKWLNKKDLKKTWGFPQNDVQPSSSLLALSYICPCFSYFPTFLSHSLHFLPKNTRWEWVWKGKHSVFIVFFQLAAAHFDIWGVQGISNTPRIISPLGKSHGMVFNLALSCSDFPNLSYFPVFLPYSRVLWREMKGIWEK